MGAVCHNTRSTQANETDEDTNNAERDLFSDNEEVKNDKNSPPKFPEIAPANI